MGSPYLNWHEPPVMQLETLDTAVDKQSLAPYCFVKQSKAGVKTSATIFAVQVAFVVASVLPQTMLFMSLLHALHPWPAHFSGQAEHVPMRPTPPPLHQELAWSQSRSSVQYVPSGNPGSA